MNDYSGLLERKQHLEHIKTREEADAFCQAYGEVLEQYARDKEKEMDKSGEREEAGHLLIALIVFGVIITIFMAGSETLEATMIFDGLMYGVIIPTIAKCLGCINYVTKLTTLAEGFKHLDELKGLTEERALDYTNNLVDRYNRMVDDNELTIVDVYNYNYKKNPEKGANIAIVSIGVLVFLMIVFCVINELIGL